MKSREIAYKIIHVLMLVLSLLNMQSCTFNRKDEHFSTTPLRYPAPNKMYKRDSFFLAYTQYMYNYTNIVGSIGAANINNLLRNDVDTILYSNDNLKLVAFIIEYIRDVEDVPNTYHYNGFAIIGYRGNILMPWIVYPTHFTTFMGYDNYNMLRDRLRKEFFQWFKDEKMWYWSSEKQRRELFAYEYNVNDPSFWDSCYIWKKGVSPPPAQVFFTGE